MISKSSLATQYIRPPRPMVPTSRSQSPCLCIANHVARPLIRQTRRLLHASDSDQRVAEDQLHERGQVRSSLARFVDAGFSAEWRINGACTVHVTLQVRPPSMAAWATHSPRYRRFPAD